MTMNEFQKRYPHPDEIPRLRLDTTRSTELEGWWEYPGMFWRWSTGPIRRLAARIRA